MDKKGIINRFLHTLMVKRVLKAYNKKVERRLAARADLQKTLDAETTSKHLALWGRLGLPCSDKWLRLYTNLTGESDYTYLPEDLFFARIERVLNNCDRAGAEAEDKNLLPLFVDKKYLPKTYVRFIRGIYYDEDYAVLTPQQADDILHCDHGRLIGKQAVDSLGDHGVMAFGFKQNEYVSSDGIVLTAQWIKSQGESYVVQALVEQCAFSKQFNPHSANTCRITTLRCPWNGEVVVCKAAMRFGVTEAAVDNMASGGIATGMSADGELGAHAYSWNGMRKYDRHPTTGIPFKGQKHPLFGKMCEVVISQSKHIPNFNLMSWDVIADKNDNVVIIELNLTSQGTDVHQFAFGSFFGAYTEQVVDWVAAHTELDTFKHLRSF